MRRSYAIALLYAGVLVAAWDVHSLVRRLLMTAPDPVAWEKIIVAVFLQATAFGAAATYLRWITAKDRRLVEETSAVSSQQFKLLPLAACGLLVAWSAMALHNGLVCGNHPLPTNRGMSVCPR